MIQTLDTQISDTHTLIRRELRRLHLHQRCLNTYQLHRRLFIEAESSLKRRIKSRGTDVEMLSVFLEGLKITDKKKIRSRQANLLSELNMMTTIRIIPFIRSRLKIFEKDKQRLRSLKASERKLLLQMEKHLEPYNLPKLKALDNYIIKIADLRADMEELSSARKLGEEIKKAVQAIIHQLVRAEKRGLPIDFENPQASGPVLNKLFLYAVMAEMHICAFNNEIREFSAGRDMNFHLEVLRDYKTTFFNNLILDCVSESKIRLTLPYSRSFLNSLEVILRGIDSRLGRLDNELSLTTVEKEAIIARIPMEEEAEEPEINDYIPEAVTQ